MNIAVDPRIKGEITLRLDCVDLRAALRLVLPQASAEFCESENLLRVSRRGTHACKNPEPFIEQIRSDR
jgi:hypothetical protein